MKRARPVGRARLVFRGGGLGEAVAEVFEFEGEGYAVGAVAEEGYAYPDPGH